MPTYEILQALSRAVPQVMKPYYPIYLMPLDGFELKPEDYVAVRRRIIEEFVRFVANKANAKEEDIVVMRLKPTELGYASNDWVVNVTSTDPANPTKLSEVTVPDDTVYILLAIFKKAETDVAAGMIVYGTAGEKLCELVGINEILVHRNPKAVLSVPLVFGPKERFTIAFYGHTTGNDYVGIEGYKITTKSRAGIAGLLATS